MSTAALAIATNAQVRARLDRAAAAGQAPLEHTPPGAAAHHWLRAPTVFVDSAIVVSLAEVGLARRAGVVVVAAEALTHEQWQASIRLGTERVVGPEDDDRILVDILATLHDADGDGTGAAAPLIAVLGACGGAGGSVFAAALACVAARTRRVLLCDLDPVGAGLEVLLGMEAAAGARWGDINAAHGRVAASALRRALPVIPDCRGNAVLLGYGVGVAEPVDIAVVDAVLDATRRAGELTIIDLPRMSTAPIDAVVRRADLTVLLSPADVRGCYAAARHAFLLADAGATVGVVVRGPSPGGVGAADISAALGVPVLAAMRPQPGLARRIDGGLGLGAGRRGPLRRAAMAVLQRVGEPV